MKNLIVTGYSGGGGKSHLVNKIMHLVGDTHTFSISHTTRKPRGNEEEGKHYYYIDEATFVQMIKAGMFLEWSQNEYTSTYYGTSIQEYQRIIALGKMLAFDTDYKGLVQLAAHPATAGTLCSIVPLPNKEKRRDWMIRRGDMSEETMTKRLEYSEGEERLFFEDPVSINLIDWRLEPYDEVLPLPDDILANSIANYISGYTKELKSSKSLIER